MKRLITAICFMLATAPVGFAQDKAKDVDKKAATATEKSAKPGEKKNEPTDKQKAQQARMKECSTKAGDRKGEERKQYMSACLKGTDPDMKAGGKSAQQDKMKACNKEAGDKKMKGDDRKAFMKDCLSK